MTDGCQSIAIVGDLRILRVPSTKYLFYVFPALTTRSIAT
jgi:hypothetical protein